jgi:hypothetical protein
MPRFNVMVVARLVTESTLELLDARATYFSGVFMAIEADSRVSDTDTVWGPEGTIISNFVVSAANVDGARQIACEVFRVALLDSGERREWMISAGGSLSPQ